MDEQGRAALKRCFPPNWTAEPTARIERHNGGGRGLGFEPSDASGVHIDASDLSTTVRVVVDDDRPAGEAAFESERRLVAADDRRFGAVLRVGSLDGLDDERGRVRRRVVVGARESGDRTVGRPRDASDDGDAGFSLGRERPAVRRAGVGADGRERPPDESRAAGRLRRRRRRGSGLGAGARRRPLRRVAAARAPRERGAQPGCSEEERCFRSRSRSRSGAPVSAGEATAYSSLSLRSSWPR